MKIQNILRKEGQRISQQVFKSEESGDKLYYNGVW